MATYLVIKNNDGIKKSYECRSTHTANPYLVVNKTNYINLKNTKVQTVTSTQTITYGYSGISYTNTYTTVTSEHSSSTTHMSKNIRIPFPPEYNVNDTYTTTEFGNVIGQSWRFTNQYTYNFLQKDFTSTFYINSYSGTISEYTRNNSTDTIFNLTRTYTHQTTYLLQPYQAIASDFSQSVIVENGYGGVRMYNFWDKTESYVQTIINYDFITHSFNTTKSNLMTFGGILSFYSTLSRVQSFQSYQYTAIKITHYYTSRTYAIYLTANDANQLLSTTALTSKQTYTTTSNL